MTQKFPLIIAAVLAGVILLVSGCGQPAQTSIAPPAALTITTPSLPDGQVGIIYSQTLKASGGSGKYSWTLTQGKLPAGLEFNSGGSINGMTNVPGTSSFTVQVNDGLVSATREISLTIKPSITPLSVETTSPIMGGEVGVPYSRVLGASGGSGGNSWAISGGQFPEGLSLDAGGTISGTPKKEGQYTYTVQVKDSRGTSADQILGMTIRPALKIGTTRAADGKVGVEYSQYIDVIGGFGNQNWSISGGALPDGLTIDSTGEILGIPQKAGKYIFTVKVVDSLGAVSTQDLTIVIAAAD